MLEPHDFAELKKLFSQAASPFACFQPNPSIVLDTQNSWGRTEDIVEGDKQQVVKVQLPVMAYCILAARAIEFDNGTNPTQLYPFVRIKYGNGNVLTENVLDATGGWMEAVVGSTFEMEVFLADDEMFPPEPGSGASMKIQGWGCVGVLPYPQRNTEFFTSATATPSVAVSGPEGCSVQGRIVEISGFVEGASATPAYLLFFDSNVAPGAPGFGTPKILLAVPIGATGVVTFDKLYTNTRPFINGVSYGISSSPTAYVAGDTVSVLDVTVETLRDA
jgi:hypothetical protein